MKSAQVATIAKGSKKSLNDYLRASSARDDHYQTMRLPLSVYVARELAALKARNALTNADIAELTNLSESTIAKTLSGRQAIDIDRIALICEALDASASHVIGPALRRYEQQKRSPHSTE